ncbi:hypothetical protein [Empedobacter brevis]|uniref:hypothetical protein n=1 Tax=Empedobacter brevis TaxID=247 RepID=UPI0028D60D18|nr:hypothetical protein [Empedobacter brevis]
MTFDYKGYELKKIQLEPCFDQSIHLYTYIYKFYSPKTKYHYILRAEYHKNDVFAIKFYRKLDRGNENKYSKIINAGDMGNILVTCASILPILLKQDKYKYSSFCLAGASSIDNKGYVENKSNNQRFKIYSYIIKRKIGDLTFAHFEYPKNSSYMLINKRSSSDIKSKEKIIKNMFFKTYNTIDE